VNRKLQQRVVLPFGGRRGFTLVELILVMALLMIVTSVSAPSLGKFFAGRTIGSEAKRIVGLTRYGQSRAVSEGVPMVLTFDLQNRAYRLAEDETFSIKNDDPRALQFNLAGDLKMDVLNTTPVESFRATIRFLPDGSFGPDSCEAIQLDDGKREKLWVTLAENRLHYEITKEPGHWLR
jgi:type II secretion system protein H